MKKKQKKNKEDAERMEANEQRRDLEERKKTALKCHISFFDDHGTLFPLYSINDRCGARRKTLSRRIGRTTQKMQGKQKRLHLPYPPALSARVRKLAYVQL